MTPSAKLLPPPPDLSACLFGAIVRDTRGAKLSDEDRLNFFPASPLVSLTHVAVGELRMLSPDRDLVSDWMPYRQAPARPATFVMPPLDSPTASWSTGSIYAISVGIYPDAWARIDAPDSLLGMLAQTFLQDVPAEQAWSGFCTAFASLVRTGTPGVSETVRVSNWVRTMLVRAALTGPGKSVRSIERRLKRWTGRSRRALEFYASFEELHRIAVKRPDGALAELAQDAGYADQSHMGRAVRRGTGFSPALLNRSIDGKEAFWCYRLLGERY